ncbi:MAG: hypothetical protein UU32_C0004G0007 [Candidatus Woesebacteria bacterium GW2011_GWB1_41_10]|uniref:Nucleotidyl transferase AbiEii/AbiGii toxin family protein n=1 Tax=Candidatus Woesebacteria bacterium GW2011_GWB1_41_10 TaxID=1618577 RepID=A0A0G0XIZ6_9BACT|nr:MAG: hypothetical protein UU32_C0004G0007 [Candidatus Woesebacteria bacterium GW2011_GWB1_41_10]
MLTKEQLFLIQNKFQTTPENMYREYSQHLFLSYLYRTRGSENVFFKGGTAYRIAFKSPRFSEDLDFSASQIDFGQTEKMILSVLKDLSDSGINCTVEESKPTTGGYLAKMFVEIIGKKALISIQISSREKGQNTYEAVDIINEYIPTYQVLLLPKRIMIGEKIQAALTRSKPRDFYDIYFLLKNGLLTVTEKDKLIKVKEILIKKKIKFADELSHFLPASVKLLANSFPKPLLSEIDKFF